MTDPEYRGTRRSVDDETLRDLAAARVAMLLGDDKGHGIAHRKAARRLLKSGLSPAQAMDAMRRSVDLVVDEAMQILAADFETEFALHYGRTITPREVAEAEFCPDVDGHACTFPEHRGGVIEWTRSWFRTGRCGVCGKTARRGR